MTCSPTRRARRCAAALATVVATASPLAASGEPRSLDELAARWRSELASAGFAAGSLGGESDRLAYMVAGEGETLLFLHGVGDQGATWHAVAPAFTAGYRVVLADLPGHGGSEPLAGETLPMATVVAGAERLLAEVAAERPAIVVGHSMGAWLATLLAHRHPAAVARLVLVNGGAVPGDPGAPSLMPATREQAAYLMSWLRDPASPPVPDWLLDDLVRRAPTGATARLVRDLPGLVAHMLVGRLGQIATPVDLLWGASDRLMTAAYAERMAQQFPAARLTFVERCGHLPQSECPARFREALATILASPPPQPAAAAATAAESAAEDEPR